MKKTKILLISVLVLCLCLSFTACGRSSSSAAATLTQPPQEEVPAAPAQSEEENEARPQAGDDTMEAPGETEPAETMPPNYHTVSREIRGFASTFSEGRAWVKYYPTPETDSHYFVYGLIDESGYVYVTAENAGTPVSGGYTAVIRDDGFDIYDLNGNCTYSHTDSPEYICKLAGSGDGVFPVVEYVSDFSGTAYYLTAIDAYGQYVCEKHTPQQSSNIDDPMRFAYSYLGEGVFYRYGAYVEIFNPGSDCYLPFGYDYRVSGITPFYNGEACAVCSLDGGNSYCFEESIKAEDLSSKEAFQTWYDNAAPLDYIHNWVISEFSGIKDSFGEGYVVAYASLYNTDKTSIYYNHPAWFIAKYSGELDAFFPDYPEGVKVESYVPVSGGYIALLLRGADGYRYFTILDTEGNQVYEPVAPGKIDRAKSNFFSTQFRAANGHIFFSTTDFTGENGYAKIDPTGQVTFLSGIPADWNNITGIDDDYVYFERCLTDYEGNILLDHVSFLEYDDGRPEAPENVEKDYVHPDSYVIEGKWKSVGSYGFGQAQPGAIVSFDGTHCNLYSPADTYAFYKSGKEFNLDCTSVLSGTVSFTVRIVDNDHIDLYNGGQVTELVRVG
ncbi:MAG: hypothetical protein IKQ04_05120 [Oscillospiraceae bacterium]|nr:hypothetical protein [Oscillospiraceae bacterium]